MNKKQINMKFSPELLKRMDTAAQNRGQTRTKLVELAVERYLKKPFKPKG